MKHAMHITILSRVAGSAVALALLGGVALAGDDDAAFRRCLDGMLGGAAGVIDASACTPFQDLNSAYQLYCARRMRIGFATVLERDACARYFEDQALRIMRSAVVDKAN